MPESSSLKLIVKKLKWFGMYFSSAILKAMEPKERTCLKLPPFPGTKRIGIPFKMP